MLLSSDLAAHQSIPKEYDLDIQNESTKNTYLFTEKDLPGFKSRANAKFDLASANMPSRLTRPAKVDKPYVKGQWEYFKRAIPS